MAAMREPMGIVVAGAIADVVVQCVMTGYHHLTREQIAHLQEGMQTRDVDRIGRALALELVGERLPQLQELRDAASEVRGALLRRILIPPRSPRVPPFRIPDA